MPAGFDSFGEGPECDVSRDAAVAFADHVAVPGVDGDGRPVPVEAVFEEPVRLWRAGLLAALFLGFPPFDCRDLLPHLLELQGQPGLQGAEAGQIRRKVVHVFDSMMGA